MFAKKIIPLLTAMLLVISLTGCGESYVFPEETREHEGTWLTWPHDYGTVYDYYEVPVGSTSYRDDLEAVWVDMTKALSSGETVHIIAFDEAEQAHIEALLQEAGVDPAQIDFFLCETDDVWIRDTGPMFAFDSNQNLVIVDFAFDGWGEDQGYARDNALPKAIADAYGIDLVEIPELVLEGGAFELDGAGTLLAAKSSIVSEDRNIGKTVAEAEKLLRKYLGVTHIVWIEGSVGEDITDAHIDGTARFINDHQLFVCSQEEYKKLYEYDDDAHDWNILETMVNAKGEKYELVTLPLTQDTIKAYGEDQGYYGSYTNYYVGNKVVLVPQYQDPRDEIALEIIGQYYPEREIIGIDCANLIYYGGMIHCVTQQQPAVK